MDVLCPCVDAINLHRLPLNLTVPRYGIDVNLLPLEIPLSRSKHKYAP